MIRRFAVVGFYLRLGCSFLPLVAFGITWYVESVLLEKPLSEYDVIALLQFLIFSTLVWGIVSQYYGVSNPEQLLRVRTGIWAALVASMVTYTVIFAVLAFYHAPGLSPGAVSFSGILMLAMSVALRQGFRRILRAQARKHALRFLIIGSDRFARSTTARLMKANMRGCTILGYVRLPEQPIEVPGPVYELSELPELKHKLEIDDVVIAVPPTHFAQLPELVARIEQLCLPVRAVVDFGRGVIARDKLLQIGNLHVVDLGSSPIDTLDYIFLKRAFDLVFSVCAILLTLPLLFAIAVAIKLTSPGPVLFLQDRVGLNGKVFKMYKFRTMRSAPAAESDVTWTTQNDPRRTWFGGFLRKSSLDELPQFFNVLKGDMSVVGPRPERPHFTRKFLAEIAQYDSRHRLKVGITGWAQVNGLRGDTSISKRVEYDLYYIQNWKFGFDIRIILMTIWSGLVAKNAY